MEEGKGERKEGPKGWPKSECQRYLASDSVH